MDIKYSNKFRAGEASPPLLRDEDYRPGLAARLIFTIFYEQTHRIDEA